MIGATIRKDVLLLLRDKGALASMFALPVVFITVFGLIFNGQGGDDEKDAKRIPLAVFAPPGGEIARNALEDLQAATYFEIKPAAAIEEIDRLIAAKDAAGGIHIPPDFDPVQRRPMTLVVDQALPDAERMAVEGPIQGALAEKYYRRTFGTGGNSRGIFIPGLKDFYTTRSPAGLRKKREYADGFQITVPSNAVLFVFFLCVAVALSFCEERKSGTWRRLLAAPVSRRTVLVAKLVPFFVIGLLQMAFLFAIGILAFGMDVSGSYGALALVTVAVVFCATALGFLISAFGGSEKQIGGIVTIVVLIMGMISGCMLPRFLLPDAMKTASLFVPHGWALDAYRDILVREGTTMADMLLPAAVLGGFGVLYSLAGALIFRFER